LTGWSPNGRSSDRVLAGSSGGFVASFSALHFSSCDGYKVRATGDKGSSATITLRAPECPQPVTP
jgi:hypothetical protein